MKTRTDTKQITDAGLATSGTGCATMLGMKVKDGTLSVRTLQHAVGLTRRGVQAWVERGIISPIGQEPRGRGKRLRFDPQLVLESVMRGDYRVSAQFFERVCAATGCVLVVECDRTRFEVADCVPKLSFKKRPQIAAVEPQGEVR